MNNATGSCPICEKPFKDGDDVVICPCCGAPYHRGCYTSEGRCRFEDRHGAGFAYNSAPPDKAAPVNEQPVAPGEGKAFVCSHCQTINDPRHIFCEKCGKPLNAAPQPPRQAFGAPQGGPFQGFPPLYQGRAAQGAGVDYGDLSGEIDGVSKQDWAEFIGPSAPAYLYRLDIMAKRNRKISFVISAFFLSAYYFAYRKLWKWAAISFGVQALATVSMLLWQLTQMGIITVPLLTDNVLYTANYALSYLLQGFRLALAIFALQIYRKDALKKIGEIRKTGAEGQQYHQALRSRGGVSVAGVAALVLMMFLLSGLLAGLIGYDNLVLFRDELLQTLLG